MAIVYTPESRRDARNYPRRVYYSCHEEDHSFLDDVSQQIHQFVEDCVIAFRQLGTPLDDSHLNEVEDFPLAVIPVTHAWFRDGVHQQEFARLKEQKKPMIPILYHDSLVERFNAHTEEMQFLRRSDPEYSEKLKRALQSLLLDQKTVEDVHKVFTHKLFIAYCREDLEQVGKLIRCVHQSEEGRHISVWFDKYLQPGRNFEEVIFSHLNDSQLFGMVLTQSLAQRDTYVKRQEYPHALTEGKKVVVFQLTDADWHTVRTELDRIAQEKGIPIPEYRPVQVSRDDSFSQFIKKLLKEVKGRSTEIDAREKDYLLGLAYRNGIGVEFDYRYAMQKFKAAADAGEYRAAHCLAEMYYHGVGVRRDLKQAKKWYIREIEYLFDEYQKCVILLKMMPLMVVESEDRIIMDTLGETVAERKEDILKMAGKLVGQACLNARILRDNGYWEDAKSLYQRAQNALEWSENHVNRVGVKAKYGKELENELNQFLIYLGERNPDVCKKIWDQARDEWKDDDIDSCYNAVKSGHNYALVLMLEGMPETARQVMELALKLIESTRKTLPQRIREIQLLLYRDIGKSYLLQCGHNDARRKEIAAMAHRNFQSMLQLFEEYSFDVEENPDLLCIIPQGSLLKAEAYFFAGDYFNAFLLYAEALIEGERTQKQLGDLSLERDLSISFLQMYGEIAVRLSSYQKVPETIIERYRTILEQFEPLHYNERHQIVAQEYLDKIRTALKIWENQDQ